MDKFIVIQENLLNIKYITNIKKWEDGIDIYIRVEHSFYNFGGGYFAYTYIKYDTIEERDKDFEQIKKELLKVTTNDNPNE